MCSQRTHRNSCLSVEDTISTSNRDFKIYIDTKSGARHIIHLVATTVQDKEAWISDISQCMDNIHLHSMLSPGFGGSSGGLYFIYCFLFSLQTNMCLLALPTNQKKIIIITHRCVFVLILMFSFKCNSNKKLFH